MSAYTEQTVSDRLASLVNTQQSIETVSRWMIYHRKRHAQSVALWEKEFHKADKDQQLVFIYLANDIIQGSRKKGPEFVKEFSKVLKRCVADLGRGCSEDILRKVNRVFDVWEDRQVYPGTFVNELRKALHRSSYSPSQQYSAERQVDDVAPPMPADLLPSGPEVPIARAQRLVEENEVTVDMFNEKVVAIRSAVLNGDALLNIASAGEFTMLAQEVDEASRAIVDLKRALEEDEQRRSSYVQLLTEALERQESAAARTAGRLQECDSKASLIDDVKSRMKAMLPSFPQVYASAGLRPPAQQQSAGAAGAGSAPATGAAAAATARKSAAAASPVAPRASASGERLLASSLSTSPAAPKVFGEEFNRDFDDDMHMDESDGESDGPSKKPRLSAAASSSDGQTPAAGGSTKAAAPAAAGATTVAADSAAAAGGFPAGASGANLSYQQLMRSLEQFTQLTAANAGSAPPPALPFSASAPKPAGAAAAAGGPAAHPTYVSPPGPPPLLPTPPMPPYGGQQQQALAPGSLLAGNGYVGAGPFGHAQTVKLVRPPPGASMVVGVGAPSAAFPAAQAQPQPARTWSAPLPHFRS